jgi:peptide/nickel transport system substrate-binding protein
MLKQDLQDIGIKINFKPIEFNSLVNKITNSLDWDCVIIGFTGSALEPHSGKNVWYSYGPLHLFNKRLSDEKTQDIEPWEIQLDNIFNQAALKLNFKERKKLYDQYQQIVYDYKPIIYLYSPLRIVALRNKFGNIYPSQLEGLLHNPEEIYIKKDNN